MFPVSDVIPSRRVPFVTIGLIVVNALVFLYQVTLSPVGLELFVGTYALTPAWLWWPSLFTSQFLHAGWMHVTWNMVYLWVFGDNVEDRLGHGRARLAGTVRQAFGKHRPRGAHPAGVAPRARRAPAPQHRGPRPRARGAPDLAPCHAPAMRGHAATP